jgi:hypothetical protein
MPENGFRTLLRVAYLAETLGADAFAFRIEASSDAGATWRPFMEGRYRRVGP